MTMKGSDVRVLHIDASARTAGSASRRLSAHFVRELAGNGLELAVDRLDLAVSPPRHFGAAQTAATYLPIEEHTTEMTAALAESDALCDRVLAADAIVCGVPVYNFGMPSVFKAFIDHVSRRGRTFDYTDRGLVGHLAGKKAAFLISSGGDYRPGAMFHGMDGLTPHLTTIFGFLGLTDPDIIHAQPMQFDGPAAKEAALDDAEAAATAVAKTWSAT